MTKEPDLDALPETTPSALRRLIARCLRKDPRIAAARHRARRASSSRTSWREEPPRARPPAETPGRPPRRSVSRRRERRGWLAVAVALGALAAGLAVVHFREAPPSAATRRPVRRGRPRGVALPPVGLASAVARRPPDPVPGRSRGHGPELRRRGSGHGALDAPPRGPDRPDAGRDRARRAPGLVAGRPSPSAFFADGEIRRLNLAERPRPEDLRPAPGRVRLGSGLEGGRHHRLRLGGQPDGEIFTVAADGGEPQPLAPADAADGETLPQLPAVSARREASSGSCPGARA